MNRHINWHVDFIRPAETLDRYENNVDYGIRRIVVAVRFKSGKETGRLIWIPGQRNELRIFGPQYTYEGKALATGTRLSQVIKDQVDVMAAALDVPVNLIHEHVKLGRTVYLRSR